MARLATTLAGGALIGILAMLALDHFNETGGRGPEAITRNITEVAKVTPAVAESLRDEQYASLTSIEDVIALPTEFARAEAMHVLAGRSGSAETQGLIFEANRIADDMQRGNMLHILFARLAEIDPQSALALARTDALRATRSFEATVWRTWAHNDLEEALFVAKTQTSNTEQRNAAQSLYAAFGFMGNETTDRIEAELGIGPDRSIRTRYLYRMADRSVNEAIAFINGIGDDIERRDYVTILGNYLASKDPSGMLAYAGGLTDTTNRDQFTRMLNVEIARENPRAVLDKYLAGELIDRSGPDIHSAARALAKADLDLARQYFYSSNEEEFRRVMGSAFAAELAREDPVAAIAWARENESQLGPLRQSVLYQVARDDPRTAVAEALRSPDSQARTMLVSNLVSMVARKNPQAGATLLAEISEPNLRSVATGQFVNAWMNTDPDSAVEWALSLADSTRTTVIKTSANHLLHTDLDAAIRLLPRLDEETRQGLRQSIANRLASNRSLADAQAFIRRFEGETDYEQLQVSVISGVAQTDITLARQLVAQVSDDRARDDAYTQIIRQHSGSNPAEAAQWLAGISDENARGAVTFIVVRNWYGRDPAAVIDWVTRFPAGPARDDAVLALVGRMGKPSAEQEDLIASIQDAGKRQNARFNVIVNLARSNPPLARDLLREADLPVKQRQLLERMLRDRRLAH